MPLLGFQPTKARLIIENRKDSVFVMKVVLAPEEAVELTTGGTMRELAGVLRIKERKADVATNGDPIGSLIYVAEAGSEADAAPAKFQVNVGMAADKFATLVRMANAGRLPTKFFVDAGEPISRGKAPAIGYRRRSGGRVKVWDNHAHRTVPVTKFVMILPIDLPPPAAEAVITGDAVLPVAVATNAQVAELVDDILVFQSDTRNSMFGLVAILAIVAIAALMIGIALFFR